jgi:arylformamidase
MRWVDVSMPLHEGMVAWPGDPPFELSPVSRISEGNESNVSRLVMTTHTGTHIDAPFHFCPSGARVHELDPALFFGPATVLDLGTAGPRLRAAELGDDALPQRVLFRTRNGAFASDSAFHEDFTALTPEAAERIVREGVQLVGIDYLSIAPCGEGCEATHRVLLEAGVLVVEGLDLRQVPAGNCEFVVLPLAIQHGDGAPCRALVGMEAGNG